MSALVVVLDVELLGLLVTVPAVLEVLAVPVEEVPGALVTVLVVVLGVEVIGEIVIPPFEVVVPSVPPVGLLVSVLEVPELVTVPVCEPVCVPVAELVPKVALELLVVLVVPLAV